MIRLNRVASKMPASNDCYLKDFIRDNKSLQGYCNRIYPRKIKDFLIAIKQSTSLFRFISSKIIGLMKRIGCVNMKYLSSVPSSYFTSIDVLAIQN